MRSLRGALRLRRRRFRGQALVETAIALPFLVILLAGGGQIGAIAYGNVTVDTAAREGARYSVDHPHGGLDPIAASAGFTAGQPWKCPAWNATTSGGSPSSGYAVCDRAYDAMHQALGLVDFRGGTTVLVTVPVAALSDAPTHIVLAAANVPAIPSASCPAGTVSGTVNLPSGAVASTGLVSSDATGTPQTGLSASGSPPTYSYTLCVPTGTQNVTARVTDSSNCTYKATLSVHPTNGQPNQTLNFNLASVTPTCLPTPTPTPVSTPTPTPTATPSATPTPTATASPSGPPLPSAPTCPGQTIYPPSAQSTPQWVTVEVDYSVPVFIPFIGKLFESSAHPGHRDIKAVVTMEIATCGVTQGQ